MIAAPRRFDLVGLRWSRATNLQAQVRARTAGGRWTAWTALPPSHGAGVPGTDPAFTGTADDVQLRPRGDARGLKLRFVRALPHAPAPSAHASQAPYIVPRDSWGAAQVPPRSGPSYGTVQMAFVHHTAGTIEYAPEDSPGIVLGIARYHRDSNGWNDIGYNFLVDRYGVIFEGRAGGIDAAVVGAQAQGYNSQSTGIATLGTFTTIPLDEPAMEALAKLLGFKLSLHGLPTQGPVTLISGGGETNRFPNGTPVTFERISAHRDSNETTCPGDALYAQLPDLRARAARYAVPVSALTCARPASAARAGQRVRPAALRRRLLPAGAPLAVEYTTAGSAWTPARDGGRGPRRRLGSERRAARQRAGPRGVRRRRHPRPAGIRAGQRPRRAEHGAHDRQAPRPDRHGVRASPERWRRRSRASCACSSASPAAAGCTVQRKRINVRGGRFATKVRPKTPGLYRVSIIADGVTRRRTLRALR